MEDYYIRCELIGGGVEDYYIRCEQIGEEEWRTTT